MGKFPVSVREWNACAAAKACGFTATGKDDAPVTNVSWSDAKQYVAWLAETTRKPYRLPSEAEWEYAARGGTQTKYWWGDQFQPGMVNCKNCSDIPATDQPVKVGSLKPNPLGCSIWAAASISGSKTAGTRNYQGAPADGSAWVENECSSHVIRSGSWRKDSDYARTSNRGSYDTNVRYPTHGFRVALSPKAVRREEAVMKVMQRIALSAALTCLPFAASAQGKPAPKDALLYFVWPQNGTIIKGGFWCRFGLRNMGVTHAGDNYPNSGHHHLLIDVNEPLNPNEPIPQDKSHLHFGAGQTEARIELPPGKHTLQLVLGDADHFPFNPPVVSQKITITVR